MSNKHILIVGSGSIGQRHAENLVTLNCDISCVDPRQDRQVELSQKTPCKGTYDSMEDAFFADRFDGVVIGSPTKFHHHDLALAAKNNVAILLEKPMAKTVEEARDMLALAKQSTAPILLGYTWRWWKPLSRVRRLLNEKKIGTVRHVQFHMSAHLADWHPWEPLQDFFMSSADLGGGALLDESHWIDLMVWLFGQPQKIIGHVEKISNLPIESDDNVDALAMYENGLRVSLHLDLYGRPHEKFIRFIGDDGTLLWTADPNQLKIGLEWSQNWTEENYSCERNEMFVAVAQEFLAIMEGKQGPSCTLKEGLQVMELIEAIRTSHKQDRAVQVGG